MTDTPTGNRPYREQLLAEHGEDAFGDTLVIEVASDDPLGDLRADVDRMEAGADVPARISLQPETLRRLITPRRLELIEAMMDSPPESIKDLAARVDRSYPAVHEDVDLLADLGVVVFQREGRANRPVIPYDRIEYSGVISRNEAPA
jgi:predicted transcriptional regulator